MENDRYLSNAESALPRSEAHLDLEGVAVGAHLIERNRHQHFAPETLEAAGRVTKSKAGHRTRIDVRAVGQQEPRHRPVDDRHLPVAVPRSEHQIGVANRGQKLRQVAGIVREVCVHLKDEGVVALERPLEPRQIRTAKSLLPCAMKHMNARIGGGQLIGELSGAVGRVVINHQHVESLILRKDQRHDASDVFTLVVGRYDHEGAFAQREGATSRSRNSGHVTRLRSRDRWTRNRLSGRVRTRQSTRATPRQVPAKSTTSPCDMVHCRSGASRTSHPEAARRQ